jgi:hypothetical protein
LKHPQKLPVKSAPAKPALKTGLGRMPKEFLSLSIFAFVFDFYFWLLRYASTAVLTEGKKLSFPILFDVPGISVSFY